MCRPKVADKSEAPTPKRLREARLRGQVAKSPMLVFGALTGTLGLFLHAVNPASWGSLLEPAQSLARGGSFEAARASLVVRLEEASLAVLMPFLASVMLLAIAMSVVQTGPVYAPKAFEARSTTLRFASLEAWSASLKTLLCVAVLLATVAWTLHEMLHGLGTLTMRPPAFIFTALISSLETLALRCTVAMLGLGIVDLLHQRKALFASLRMTKEEVHREQKTSEGDPEARLERHRRGRDQASDPLEALLTCTLILWSRERFLVGLAYDRERDEAPRIVVRARGEMASTLRQLGEHHGIYEAEEDALAKRLFGLDALPEDAFEWVAGALQRAWSRVPSEASKSTDL